MEIVTVHTDDLEFDPSNARTHDAKNLKAITASLKRFGQIEPLVVRAETGVVVGGNGRLAAMRAMGWTEAKCVLVDTDDQESRALALALNRTSELGAWDNAQLIETLALMPEAEFDSDVLSGLGGDLAEIMQLGRSDIDRLIRLSGKAPDIVEDEIPEAPKNPVTKLGDVWRLGKHRVVCGDCLETDYPNNFDLLATDPPYGIGEAAGKNKSRSNLAKAADYGVSDWDDKPIDNNVLMAMIAKAKYAAVFGGNYYALPPQSCWLVWDKENGENDFADAELAWTNYGTAARLRRHMWNGMLRKDREARCHPTQKPVGVMAWVIEKCPGSPKTILDPFLGSGTTLIAAEQLNRQCFGVEISPAYCDVIVERWQELTNEKATR